jgi:hypothetical protein
MGKRKQNTERSLEATDWKQKSIKRGKEAKALNKRIRELIASRDSWKVKYTEAKKHSIVWEAELYKIKKKLNEILSH